MTTGSIDLDHSLLDNILSDDLLNNLLQTTTCPRSLNSLLHTKRHRIEAQQSEKINFSLKCINDRDFGIDLAVTVLKNTLYISSDPNIHISQVFGYCFQHLQTFDDPNETLYALNLLSVVFEHYKNHNSLLECDTDQFHTIITNVLRNCPQDLTHFILTHIVPNYLKIITLDHKNSLLERVFGIVKETKKIEILCSLFDEYVFNSNEHFNLFACDDFWQLLLHGLVAQRDFPKKRALYLLTRSIDMVFANNWTEISQYLKPETICLELEKVWHNYFILLDASDERQLHLIEPSLQLLNSTTVLHSAWRACLYRNFLKHSQKVVVYRVARFVLQNERYIQNEMIKEVLVAINKNEYNGDSRAVFDEICSYCKKLTGEQFMALLDVSLEIVWVPASIWCFYSNIFVETNKFQFSLTLLERILKSLTTIPHVFIRNACKNLVLNYYARVCSDFKRVDDFVKIARWLVRFNEPLLNFLIKSNRNLLTQHSNDLRNELLNCTSEDSERIEILTRIYKILETELVTAQLTSFKISTDLIYVNLFVHFDKKLLENYVITRMDSLKNNDSVQVLIELARKLCTKSILDAAFNVLLNPDCYNDAQKTVCFAAISAAPHDNCIKVIDVWIDNIFAADEQIVQFFAETLCKNFQKSSLQFERVVSVLENILDLQNKATVTVLENISLVTQNSNGALIFGFVKKCFGAFLWSTKSGVSEQFTREFLSHIFDQKLVKHDQYSGDLAKFCFKLISASSGNGILYLVCENVANLCEIDKKAGSAFVPVIFELIFYGIKIQKCDRVEYNVCQDIMHRLNSVQNNPNFEEASVRLWAFDAMLSLAPTEDANRFVSLLVDKFMSNFNRRYFPDSDLHLQKLRIMQALVLLHGHTTSEKPEVINMIITSFVSESHQPSVKHLMQWLLILWLRTNTGLLLELVDDKLKTADHNRPSTISGLIPILYHMSNTSEVEQIVKILLPYTMGPQFKLRIFSQVALLKLFQKDGTCSGKYDLIEKSLQKVVDATSHSLCEETTIKHEFLEYFSLKLNDHSDVFYTIPKKNGVSGCEWENLGNASIHNKFNHLTFNDVGIVETSCDSFELATIGADVDCENVQKKITPWKYNLDTVTIKDHDSLILVASLLEKTANLGGLSRTCEIFGIKHMALRTAKVTSDKEFKSLSMSSENWVDYLDVKVTDLSDFLVEIKRKGYSVVAAEQTAQSVKLGQFHFPKLTVLLLGNEKQGIPWNLFPHVDHWVEIPQMGVLRSLNVHVAGAVMIWEYCKQHKL